MVIIINKYSIQQNSLFKSGQCLAHCLCAYYLWLPWLLVVSTLSRLGNIRVVEMSHQQLFDPCPNTLTTKNTAATIQLVCHPRDPSFPFDWQTTCFRRKRNVSPVDNNGRLWQVAMWTIHWSCDQQNFSLSVVQLLISSRQIMYIRTNIISVIISFHVLSFM